MCKSVQNANKMNSLQCSFIEYSKKECGTSVRYQGQTAVVPLKACTKDVVAHLKGCFKTTTEGAEVEWKLCLCRLVCLTLMKVRTC